MQEVRHQHSALSDAWTCCVMTSSSISHTHVTSHSLSTCVYCFVDVDITLLMIAAIPVGNPLLGSFWLPLPSGTLSSLTGMTGDWAAGNLYLCAGAAKPLVVVPVNAPQMARSVTLGSGFTAPTSYQLAPT